VITADKLKEVLNYNKETGVFTRIKVTSNRVKIGDYAGCLTNNGYLSISALGIRSLAHRLAWLYCNGEISKGMDIDHINGDKADNRLNNLRIVSRSENMQNRRKAKVGSKTGFLGVTMCRDTYQASISVKGKNVHLGTFITPELAYSAYVDAKRRLHPACTI